ncbi:MAG TPA: BMP family ABC transporter substrate-binding protein [Streptosporangiaceae bacterium]|nr:BMP family ABC transporter substrate-binding protein [Streptosporangiaceae bacterium]
MRKRAIVVAFAAVAALALAACGSSSTTSSTHQSTTTGKQITAAWIYVGSPSDAGWTHQHDLGRLAVQQAFGSKVKTVYKQNVPEGPQTTSVIQQLVNSGAKIIFATSFGYQPSMAAMAKKYPNVYFAQATGTAMGKNLSEYFGAGEDGDYLAGMAAGYATKNGKIGYVAPFPIPEVIREIDAYTMGARYAHPGATVRVVWTNSWFDPSKERAAAQSLVSAGVDVLGDGVDDPTVGQVAQANGLKWTGYDSNQNSFAPKAFLTATVYNWSPYYVNSVRAAMGSTWKSSFYYGSIADKMIGIAPFGKSVSATAQKAILKRQAEMTAGTFNPFTGPLIKQDGSVGLRAGQTLPVWTPDNPSQLSKYTLNWFVQGVIGSAKG